jgi:hypothetical protein
MRQVLCGAEIFYDPLDMRVIDRHVKLLVYAVLSYYCMSKATSVCGLQLLVYAAFSY